MAKIRVLLADDHPITPAGIRYFLKTAADITIVAEARSGQETLDLIELYQPDVVLLDIEMPDMSGLEVAKHLKERTPPIRFLILRRPSKSMAVRP